MQDRGSAKEGLAINAGVGILETGRHETQFRVDKWNVDQVNSVIAHDYDNRRFLLANQEPTAKHFKLYGVKPFKTYVKKDCNLITDLGWQMIMNGVAGSAVTKFVNATSGRIGLGTSATAVAYTDTQLGAIGALTTANWKVINAVPTVGSTHGAGLILAATFGLTEANGVAIQEFATDIGTASTLSTAAVGTFFSHGNATPGTKTSSQVWNVTVTITWT